MISKIQFTKSQWNRISEITSNLGIVSLVAFVIPYFTEEVNYIKAIAGLVISISMWYLSFVAARRY